MGYVLIIFMSTHVRRLVFSILIQIISPDLLTHLRKISLKGNYIPSITDMRLDKFAKMTPSLGCEVFPAMSAKGSRRNSAGSYIVYVNPLYSY